MGVGSGLYMHDVVIKSSRSLSHRLMSSCLLMWTRPHCRLQSAVPQPGSPVLLLFLADVNSRSRSLIAVAIPSVVCLSVCL